jgi:DedD protein
LHTRYKTDRDLHHDLQDLHEAAGQDREISLGTTTILGIFLALTLLCAVFFGFGYSLGRRSAQPAASPTETIGSESNSSKPAPGSTANQPASKQSAAVTQSAIVPIDLPNTATQDTQLRLAADPVKAVVSTPRADVHAEPSTSTSTKSAAMVPVSATAPSPGSLVVQVAAMSHQEDADVVAVDLKRRGYTVTIRHEPQDKLFHVQIGPFFNRKEADAMRLRLQTDGYNNAIVK